MSAISDNLIHFLARAYKESPQKQFEIFKLIVQSGLRTGQVQIKLPDGASVFNQIICFTDIPLRECNEHTSVYGKFGIGFKKSYVKRLGGNPARYFLDYVPGSLLTEAASESRGALYFNLWELYKFMAKLSAGIEADPNIELLTPGGKTFLNAAEVTSLKNLLIYCFSFDKEMGDLGTARDETREIDLYYKEREWRLVPSKLNELAKNVRLDEAAQVVYYSFERADVNMFVVPNEELRLAVLQHLLSFRESSDARLRAFAEDPPPIINYDDLGRW